MPRLIPLLFLLPLAAQSQSTATLSGRVSDPSGAVVPGATLILHGKAGDITTRSGPSGTYTVAVPPGFTGTLSVSMPGFAPYLNPHVKVDRTQTLDIQLIIATQTEQVEVTDTGDPTDPNNNADSITLRQKDIDLLPTNQTELMQQLTALSGGDSPEIMVNGFSGGTLPPKDTIREIRINQNPYSAQNDTNPLGGQIEIFTKPGSDKFHLNSYSEINDSAFNSRNPFSPNAPSYYTLFAIVNVSGPINKTSSYFLSFREQSQQSNAVISTTTLDPATLVQTPFSQALGAPTTTMNFSARYDAQLGKKSTLLARYSLDRTTSTNGGVGQQVLAQAGYSNTTNVQTLQISNSQIVTPHIVNDTRFQYIRSRIHQTPNGTDPAIVVQGSFTGGGSNGGSFRDNLDRYELQNYTSYARGKNYLTFGGRLRAVRDANSSTANYNGQYIFASLNAYQLTLQGQRAGQTAAQIRASGGGVSQYSIATGTAGATVTQADLGAYLQDDWKPRPNITLSPGLRFETQSGTADHADFAPRLGLVWGLFAKKNKPAPFTLRAGAGIFYQRFGYSYELQTVRQNGVSQQQFVAQSPDCTAPDLTNPAATPACAVGTQQLSSRYQTSANFRMPYTVSETISLERRLGSIGTLATNYVDTRGVHSLLTRNVNAPLPGTYNIADPTSGTRPLGTLQNVYQYDSVGLDRGNRLGTYVNLHREEVYVWGGYTLNFVKSEGGNASAPSNPYNPAADYGRAANDIRNRFNLGANTPLPYGFRIFGFMNAQSGAPYNITIGQDINGDSQYNDRPAFATDLTRPSVVRTAYGNFDTAPIAGQSIIPINYGNGPATINTYLGLYHGFAFGPEVKPPAGTPPPKPDAKGKLPKPDRRYSLDVNVNVNNVLNHQNLATPVGTLSSPLFGRSTGLANGNQQGNRQVEFAVGFSF